MRWLTAAVLLLLLAVASYTIADPDLWGHLRFGLDALASHALPRVDPYSFTQDVPWINHEWLSELQMGIAYHAGGIAGLALLKGALTLTALLLVWTALRGTDAAARMMIVGATIVGCGWVLQNLRPQLWSLVLLALLCSALTSASASSRRLMPLLFLVWANLHGGWIVGLGVLGVWALVDMLTTRQRVVEWGVIVAASVAATLVNPYGIGLWRFLWTTVHLTRDIDEWRPLWTWPVFNWLGWVAAAVAAGVLSLRPHRDRWPSLAVTIMLAYASLRVSRLSALFIMATVMLLAPAIRERWRAKTPTSFTVRRAAGVTIAVSACASALWIGSWTLSCIRVTGKWAPPENRVQFLQAARPGRLVTYFDWGEYAIWHAGPRIRVSMDGRRETVYSERRLAEHDAIVNGTPEGLAVLAAWQAEYVWLPAESRTTKAWLAAHGYRLEVDSADSFVAVRSDLPSSAVAPASSTHERCFPG